MSYSTTPLAEEHLKTVGVYKGVDASDIAKLTSGQYDSAQEAYDISMRVRKVVEQDAPKVSAMEDRHNSGAVKRGNPAGDAFWALNAVSGAAYNVIAAAQPTQVKEDLILPSSAAAAIDTVIKFLATNQNLQNPNAVMNGETLSELRRIGSVGRLNPRASLSFDDASRLFSAAYELSHTGTGNSILDGSKIPADVSRAAAEVSTALGPLRHGNIATVKVGPDPRAVNGGSVDITAGQVRGAVTGRA